MKNKKTSIYKAKAISGYPEWLPEYRVIELQWFDAIRSVFESYGYSSIETPSVEELDALMAKGASDKEIYTLARLQADEESKKDKSDARLALHFDLTVPLARYVSQHFNNLIFPFKRYQMQRVWRGERPQKGRFREFYQCDIDVINIDNLPLHFDAEMPRVMHEIYQKLNLPEKIQIRISNRKVLVGYLLGLGIAEDMIADVTRILDKIEKIGSDNVVKQLTDDLGLDTKLAEQSLALSKIRGGKAKELINAVKALGVNNDLLEQGLTELFFVLDNLSDLPDGDVIGDLSIVRGLDYYTGTILEAYIVSDTDFGAVGSGGRYEDLTGSFINKKMPGIGISIGLTRLFSWMVDGGHLEPQRFSSTDILVVQSSSESYEVSMQTANILRNRGFNVELFHSAVKIKKQLSYAEKKGIPYVWFPPFEGVDVHEVKDMKSRVQLVADPENYIF